MQSEPLHIKLKEWTLIYNVTTEKQFTELYENADITPIDSYGSLPPLERALNVDGLGAFTATQGTHFSDDEFEYISFPCRSPVKDLSVYMRAVK